MFCLHLCFCPHMMGGRVRVRPHRALRSVSAAVVAKTRRGAPHAQPALLRAAEERVVSRREHFRATPPPCEERSCSMTNSVPVVLCDEMFRAMGGWFCAAHIQFALRAGVRVHERCSEARSKRIPGIKQVRENARRREHCATQGVAVMGQQYIIWITTPYGGLYLIHI